MKLAVDLRIVESLTAVNIDGDNPAGMAAAANKPECLQALREIGVPVPRTTKREWVSKALTEVVGDNGNAPQLDLHGVRRDNLLDGLCARLGVDEASGTVAGDVRAGPLSIRFSNENGVGDGVRREWFHETVTEILDPGKGLFTSNDGGRTLQPNPHSKLAAGDDHLSYFALLGRIAGFALFHREHVPAPWTPIFVKAAFGYPTQLGDLEAADPELFTKQVVYIRDRVYATRDGMTLAELDMTFEADFTHEDYTAKGDEKPGPVPLKPGGHDIAVTEENRMEYLQLFVEQRLVGEIRAQIKAFRDGLGVFFGKELLGKLRGVCSPAECQLLLCGTADIDIGDWEQSCEYDGVLAGSAEAKWFWRVVRSLSAEHLAQLLQFCTGSSRAPAAGFSQLQGYNGAQHRFRLQLDPGGAARLPSAATCFNTLRLPQYSSEQQTRKRLVVAITSAGGFDEGAVAT